MMGASSNIFITKIDLGPKIISATVDGKNLIVSGENFEEGAVILVDGEDQRTLNFDQDFTSSVLGKKTAKRIAPGQTVTIRVRNPDGVLSPEFSFTG
jgi:hypothetical protein